MKTIRISALILAVLLPAMAEAAPVVLGVEGNIDDDGSITITGSSFGPKETPGPILYDTIDNIPQYVPVVDGQDVPVRDANDDDYYDECPTCPWESFNFYHNRPQFETTPSNLRVPGRPVYFVTREGYFRGPDPTGSMDEDDTAYLSWWYKSNHVLAYPPGGPIYNKLLRYTAGSTAVTWEEQVEVEPQLCYGTEDGCGQPGWDRYGEIYTERAINTWHHVEVIISGGGNLSAGTGRVDVMFDGVNVIPTGTVYSCYGMLDHIYLWGSNPHAPYVYPDDAYFYFGEMYFDKTPARVMIGNSPVLADCDHSEIQIPTAWDGDSITAIVSTGTFTDGQTAYLFVVDEDNSASGGWEIEIGSGVEPPDAPSAPTGLSAQNGPERVALNWNDNPGSDNVSSYYVYRSNSSGGTYQEITSTTLSEYTNSNLEPGVIQYYKVKAENTGGRSGFSNIASATPYADPPAAPNNLVGTGGILHADLSWDSNNDEPDMKGYYVYRGDVLGSYFVLSDLLSETTYTYTDTEVVADETYFYVVRAVDVWDNESPNSNHQEVLIEDVPDDPPSAPTNLVADDSVIEQVTLSWDEHPDPDEDLAGYYLYRSDEAVGGYYGLPLGTPLLLNGITYTDYQVIPDETYYYVVQAADLAGQRSVDSNQVEATVLGPTFPPDAPTGVQATGGVELVDLLWNENAEEDLAGYYAYWGDATGGPYIQINSLVLTDTTLTHSGLVGGDTYYYVVEAVNDEGFRSDPSTEVSATTDTIPDVSPDPPTGLEGEDGIEEAILTWDVHPDPDEDLAGYHVFRLDMGQHGFTQITTDGAELTEETYTDTGLTAHKFYYYAVQAIDDGDNRSTLSDTVGVKPLPVPNPPPAAPTGLVGDAGIESASLVWADNDEADLAGYYVYRSTSPDDEFIQQNSTIQSDTTYVDAPLVGGAIYYYKVKAADTALQRSDFSDMVSVTTLVIPDEAPEPPSGLVGAAGIERATLVWAPHPDPDDDLAGYNIWWSYKEDTGYLIDNDVLITAESYIDSNLTANQDYFYVVQAEDDGGNRSGFSSPAKVRPKAAPATPNVLSPDSLEVVTTASWPDVPTTFRLLVQDGANLPSGAVAAGIVEADSATYYDQVTSDDGDGLRMRYGCVRQAGATIPYYNVNGAWAGRVSAERNLTISNVVYGLFAFDLSGLTPGDKVDNATFTVNTFRADVTDFSSGYFCVRLDTVAADYAMLNTTSAVADAKWLNTSWDEVDIDASEAWSLALDDADHNDMSDFGPRGVPFYPDDATWGGAAGSEDLYVVDFTDPLQQILDNGKFEEQDGWVILVAYCVDKASTSAALGFGAASKAVSGNPTVTVETSTPRGTEAWGGGGLPFILSFDNNYDEQIGFFTVLEDSGLVFTSNASGGGMATDGLEAGFDSLNTANAGEIYFVHHSLTNTSLGDLTGASLDAELERDLFVDPTVFTTFPDTSQIVDYCWVGGGTYKYSHEAIEKMVGFGYRSSRASTQDWFEDPVSGMGLYATEFSWDSPVNIYMLSADLAVWEDGVTERTEDEIKEYVTDKIDYLYTDRGRAAFHAFTHNYDTNKTTMANLAYVIGLVNGLNCVQNMSLDDAIDLRDGARASPSFIADIDIPSADAATIRLAAAQDDSLIAAGDHDNLMQAWVLPHNVLNLTYPVYGAYEKQVRSDSVTVADRELWAESDVSVLDHTWLVNDIYEGEVDEVRAYNPDWVPLFYVWGYGLRPAWANSAEGSFYGDLGRALMNPDNDFVARTVDGDTIWSTDDVSIGVVLLNYTAPGLADTLGTIYARHLEAMDNNREHVGYFVDWYMADLAGAAWSWRPDLTDVLDMDQNGDPYSEDEGERNAYVAYLREFPQKFREAAGNPTLLIVPNGNVHHRAATADVYDGGIYEDLHINRDSTYPRDRAEWEHAIHDVYDMLDKSRVDPPLAMFHAEQDSIGHPSEALSAIARGVSCFANSDLTTRAPDRKYDFGTMIGEPTWSGSGSPGDTVTAIYVNGTDTTYVQCIEQDYVWTYHIYNNDAEVLSTGGGWVWQ